MTTNLFLCFVFFNHRSNNLAIKGVARFAAKGRNKKNHIITTVTVFSLIFFGNRIEIFFFPFPFFAKNPFISPQKKNQNYI